jgi:hypothetical protein
MSKIESRAAYVQKSFEITSKHFHKSGGRSRVGALLQLLAIYFLMFKFI